MARSYALWRMVCGVRALYRLYGIWNMAFRPKEPSEIRPKADISAIGQNFGRIFGMASEMRIQIQGLTESPKNG